MERRINPNLEAENSISDSGYCSDYQDTLASEVLAYETEERKFLKHSFQFVQQLATKFGRGQTIINTAMVFILKMTRVHHHSKLNRFLLSAGSFLLATKTCD